MPWYETLKRTGALKPELAGQQLLIQGPTRDLVGPLKLLLLPLLPAESSFLIKFD